jgi:hypothetical protein
MSMSAIRKLREKWRIRRERIKRLNAARSARGSDHATPEGLSNGGG